MPRLFQNRGYTLIEMVIVVIIIAILATVAMQSLGKVIDNSRFDEARIEMERLATAIAGNPDLLSAGTRTDYGYIGDVGSLPTTWADLAINPGLATWKGPYILDEFASGGDFAIDPWGIPYTSPNAHQFSSGGGGQPITRKLANSAGDLLSNKIIVTVVDLDFSPPGNNRADSVQLLFSYPNGIGGYRTKAANPSANGLVEFDSIPIGLHNLRTVIRPANDTLTQAVNVDPGRNACVTVQYYADIWHPVAAGPGGFEFVPGSDTLSTSHCSRLSFWMINNTGGPLTITRMTTSWIGPEAYYHSISWGATGVWADNSGLGSGEPAIFSSVQTIANGGMVRLEIDRFRVRRVGGQQADMSGSRFTVEFSDGTIVTFMAATCIH